ncbi:MAG: Aclacinomycin methylesterase RdmC [Chlamydiales bacterium]|nr:Aclacinomycin methylesterase RdmC [Chlamydiales bacterium]MCH9619423.1 Aclacinomycin methylesterase RdmC [Chlamydiales bacterium]MCH9622227.1 Aclacinomycin methylesterase RdmC [Chlamydiales bacterium]
MFEKKPILHKILTMKCFFIALLFYFTTITGFSQVCYVSVGEHQLWTESLGENRGDNGVICIHGCGSHAMNWNDIFCKELTDQGYFVIRYDQRDIGYSDPFPTPYAFTDFADDVVKIMDAYGLEKAHIIGHSMGGMIGQFVATRYPERVETLTLISSAPVSMTPALDVPLTWTELFRAAKAGAYLLHPVPENFDAAYRVSLEGMQFFNGEYPLDGEIFYTYAYNYFHRTQHPVGRGGKLHVPMCEELMMTLRDRPHFYQKLEAPTLVIHGEKDNLIFANRGGIALHEAIQDTRLKLYPKMGHHFFNRELIFSMSRDILGFYNEIRSSSL